MSGLGTYSITIGTEQRNDISRIQELMQAGGVKASFSSVVRAALDIGLKKLVERHATGAQ